MFVNSQCDGTRLQVKGLGVPQLHVQTLRGPDSTRHHSNIHEGGEGLTGSNGGSVVGRDKQTFTGTGSGRRATLVLKAALSVSQSKYNPHDTLFRSVQPPQERKEMRK